MNQFSLLIPLLCLLSLAISQPYDPDWESIETRPIPSWFTKQKFGIFIHWGVYAVPSYRCLREGEWAEWYVWELDGERGECLNEWHKKNYGDNFLYQDFASQFKADLFDPNEWADIFQSSGAKYIVFTTKHHDGFCNWGSKNAWGWNSVDVGPHRDLVGELATSIREKTDIKFGIYHSLVEWFNPYYLDDQNNGSTLYPDNILQPMLRDLIEKYKPSTIFSDGDWYQQENYWKSAEFLSWLYSESPVKDEIVVNNRWGSGACAKSCYHSVELANGGYNAHPWEEARTIGSSWGYHRGLLEQDYQNATELVHWLIRVTANGGNLLLNIGPEADGRIPLIFQERLRQIGEWLNVNSEAIFNSNPNLPEQSEANNTIYYTVSEDYQFLYSIFLKWPKDGKLVLTVPVPDESSQVKINFIGYDSDLTWDYSSNTLTIQLPYFIPGELPCDHAWTLRLSGFQIERP